jgi:polysaccharide export outer membrane protein
MKTTLNHPDSGGVSAGLRAAGPHPKVRARLPRFLKALTSGRLPLAFIAACITTFAGVGCSDFDPGPPVPSEAYPSRPSGALAPGDEISVSFSGAPEMNTKQKIQANGKVSLPTIGDVSASGRTITSFQSYLTSQYQPHLQDPTVVVALESAAAGVYVSGEVLRPGKVPLDRPITALEAVMEAGGFTKFANPKQVVVVRKEGNRNQRYVLNLNDALSGAAESRPFYLRPFDVIYVRQSAW